MGVRHRIASGPLSGCFNIFSSLSSLSNVPGVVVRLVLPGRRLLGAVKNPIKLGRGPRLETRKGEWGEATRQLVLENDRARSLRGVVGRGVYLARGV